MKTFTELEMKVAAALFVSSGGNGHDFGFTEDARSAVKTKAQLAGVISSLIKKGIIWVDKPYDAGAGPYTQMGFIAFRDVSINTRGVTLEHALGLLPMPVPAPAPSTSTTYPVGEFALRDAESTRSVMGLVCSGLESGSYGSFIIVDYVKPPKMEVRFDERDDHVYRHFEYPFQAGGATVFVDKYEAEESGLGRNEACDALPKLVLNRDSIIKGMQRFAEKYPRLYADFIRDGGDAITGDAFVQVCLLGDVVYG